MQRWPDKLALSRSQDLRPEAPPPQEPAATDESARIAQRSLSRAESRVAQLASQGYTNREISSRLYITMSTVEQHLTRIYRKLGIDRRDKLDAFFVGRNSP